MEVLRRPDYEITTQQLLAAAVVLAKQLLKGGYALADLWGDPSEQSLSKLSAEYLYAWMDK